MARDHARIHLTVWQDRDFRDLSAQAQHLYFTIISQPALSYCGVMDWWPNRLAALSKGTEESDVYGAAKELNDGDYIFIDADMGEILVRTYVRHDGIMQRANMGKAMVRAMKKVTSLDLLDALEVELARLFKESPNLPGWDGLKSEDGRLFDRIRHASKSVK